ncbi:MAG: NBR1-Ig-like domain-containing protein [Anaerolineaceae bacterium]|nr:NBR1-Ig-like domain-containing protein [Anaerolineaceae bacterium]
MNFRPLSLKFIIYLTLASTIICVSGCSLKPSLSSPDATLDAPFRPATFVPSAAPTKEKTPQPSGSKSNPDCTDQLTYISDVTIPDDTIVSAGSTMDKRWQVENSGSCNWDSGYKIKLVAGPDMGASQEQELFPARSGSRATIRIQFTAPTTPGKYRSAWQAFNPQGQAFGDLIYIQVVIASPTP